MGTSGNTLTPEDITPDLSPAHAQVSGRFLYPVGFPSLTLGASTFMKDLTWKAKLHTSIPASAAHAIDLFEGQMALMKQGKLEDKVFAETRLRKGVYGQRYDNGQRHDGSRQQQLAFPDTVKGPGTAWDAPGMQRIKIPFGALTPVQLEVLAEIADAYSDGILHVTTRQDIQLHFVHIEDTPDMMRRLAAIGITTEEACGNVVRNVTGCHLAGVCRSEPFDVSPYAEVMANFLMGHDDTQDFGRKVKVAFSGCEQSACGLAQLHDLGYIARVEDIDGTVRRGFKVVVGGGLGAVPHQARVLSEFMPVEEILPMAQAMLRIFARQGEKRNRNRARLKFLVAKLGIDEFRRQVYEERALLPDDNRWTDFIEKAAAFEEQPQALPQALNGQAVSNAFNLWRSTNAYAQRQAGYSTVTVRLPLGDFTARQAIQLADIARKYVGAFIRLTVEQNIVLRWVKEADLPALFEDLKSAGLGKAGAESITDITSCPGTDTCKLGIAASRGLAGTLMQRLDAKFETLPEEVKGLRIKISGCFNSCGQHHVADIGFYGNSRKVGNYKVPHFQVVLGGQWQQNGGSYGLAITAVPSKLVPEVLETITRRYVADRLDEEPFQAWVTRIGKKEAREMLRPFMITPDYETQPEFFSDWGDPRVFTLSDLGIGECAGEVVSLFSMEIARAESEVFEAQIAFDEHRHANADQRAYQSMLMAARALLRSQDPLAPEAPDDIVKAFRQQFYDTEVFFDQFAKGKFARYLFSRHENPVSVPTPDVARQTIEEAQLFIEAAHACDMRINTTPLEDKPPQRSPQLSPVMAAKLPPQMPLKRPS